MMDKLTRRERNLILALLALLAVFLVGAAWQTLQRRQSALEERLALAHKRLERLNKLEQDLIYLNSVRPPNIMSMPLSTFIENGARFFGLSDRLQINAITANAPPGTEGLRVQLDQLNLDHFFEMLFYMENSQPVLRVEHIEVTKQPGSRLVRASFRVYKQVGA